jgi:hypothetical protein
MKVYNELAVQKKILPAQELLRLLDSVRAAANLRQAGKAISIFCRAT